MRNPLYSLTALAAIGAALALPAAALAEGPAATTTAPIEAPAAPAGPAPETTTPTTPAPTETAPAPEAPIVSGQTSQGSSPGAPRRGPSRQGSQPGEGKAQGTAGGTEASALGAAIAPGLLTPRVPFSLRTPFSGVPAFFIESFQIPPFLLPIFQAAGTAYGVPWQVLAAINEVETDYGRDLSVSSAGAEGWMQFLPSSWAQYGVDANGDGYRDPYNPADAIFAAARYLRAAGGASGIRGAIFAYNHSQAYVESVMLRAQLLGGSPPELLGAVAGLTEARFPVHAAAHFSDAFPAAPHHGSAIVGGSIVGTAIYAAAGSPVIAVQDGRVVQIGRSEELGRFVVLRDAYGNTYTYGNLGDTSQLYPVLEPKQESNPSSRIESAAPAHESAPSGPATAGAQPRSPLSEAGTVSGLALGAAAGLEGAGAQTTAPAPATPAPTQVPRHFTSGSDEVYLRELRPGADVIAGTVLGHVGGGADGPHIVFEIRPAGAGAPPIDPKPILDGWVALENTSIFRARGRNPFLATAPSSGQVLLESKQQLQRQVLRDQGISLGDCGRRQVIGGRVDRRVLAVLEYLSVSGLHPAVAGLSCAAVGADSQAVEGLDITAVNGLSVAGHEEAGSVAEEAVRRLLMLEGADRPARVATGSAFAGIRGALADPRSHGRISVAFTVPSAARSAGAAPGLTASDWVRLISRLGEIPDPTVAAKPSSAAIPDNPSEGREGTEANGNN